MEITEHLNRQIPPLAHTPMYNWHKYWSRKTWNVVNRFIENYSKENEIVLDPFSGSGVTALESLKLGRRVIACDILPIATELLRITIKPVSLTKIHESFERIANKVKNKISDLYLTKCKKCGAEIPFTCAIWKQTRNGAEEEIKRKCLDIRYQMCPKCGDRREMNNKPTKFDINLINKIENQKIKEWYPNNKLYHYNGKPFKEKQKFESLDELFTKRNLYALALLMKAIEEEPKEIKDFMKLAFTSIVHICSALLPEGRPGYRPFSGVGWNQQSYWFSPEFMESNVWIKFEGAIYGHQSLLKAKEESNKYYKNIKFASSYKEVIRGEADIFIYNGSCLDLMQEMYDEYGEKGCVDYIFTDPPYDASVQYSELAYLWVAWLKKDKGYLEKVASDEVIRNERQLKSFDVYHSLLSSSFKCMYNVLKQGSYLTVTFHNPTFKIRNATIYAGVHALFEFEKIHHQELARPSAKSLLQPFGSAQGDFYLRFHKKKLGSITFKPEEIDEKRFESIVVETAIKIIVERNEPTPYTILINAIDPELAKRGFFSELHTGFDIKTVLQGYLESKFTLVDAKIGSTQGKLWWLKEPSKIIKRFNSVPLSERVEQTVLRNLQSKGKVTFTDVWEAVSIEFPNSHTTDSTSIREALEAYANPIGNSGFWLIKSNLRPDIIEKEHTTMIALLSEMGIAKGFDIWVGKNEQSHKISTDLVKQRGNLKEYLTYKQINKLINIQNPDIVDDVDLLWIKNNKIVKLFEVESTTSMTSGLQRGSNVDSKVNKYMIIPFDRLKQLNQKMKSPMFSESFIKDNWKIIFFEILTEEYIKTKNKTIIDDLIGKQPKLYARNKKQLDDSQTNLFE